VSAVCAAEAMIGNSIAPLLPSLKIDFGLSTAAVGWLAAMYPMGLIAGAFPSAWITTRIGFKSTMVSGLVVLAVSVVVFGSTTSTPILFLSDFIAGVGGTAAWGAGMVWLITEVPRSRRGAVLGWTFSAVALGQISGPGLGGIAAQVGRKPVYFASAAVCVALMGLVRRTPSHRRPEPIALGVQRALRDSRIRDSTLLCCLPGFLLGVTAALGPAALSHLGAGSALIAGLYVGAAVVGAVFQPVLGRLIDARGSADLISVAFAVAVVSLGLPIFTTKWSLGMTVVVPLALVAARAFAIPAVSLVVHACHAGAFSEFLSTAVIILGFTGGFIVGSVFSSMVAAQVGSVGAYAAAALVALSLGTRHRRWAELAEGAHSFAVSDDLIQT
jgi:MFS transporter, DHA1 family, multidrug resistance protein